MTTEKVQSFLLFFLLIVYFLLNTPVFAQQATSGCDLCGWCGTDSQNKPSDWVNCMNCLFPSTQITNPNTKPDPNDYYPSHAETSKNWTIFGCLDTAPGGFITQIYKIIVSIGGGLALLAFIYGGFQVLTAGEDPQRVASGKNTIMGAVFGIILILFSVFLLRLIGFEIIKIPGFE